MAEAMKARIMARVEAASLEEAQVTEAPAANAAANASEEKPAVQKAKAQARAEELAERSKVYQLTPSEKAERLRHEKEMKQLAQANRAHQAKAARAGIGTASVVLTPYDELQKALRADSDAEEEEDAPEAPAPPAKKSSMRGKRKKGVAFAAALVEKKKDGQKKDVAYYRRCPCVCCIPKETVAGYHGCSSAAAYRASLIEDPTPFQFAKLNPDMSGNPFELTKMVYATKEDPKFEQGRSTYVPALDLRDKDLEPISP